MPPASGTQRDPQPAPTAPTAPTAPDTLGTPGTSASSVAPATASTSAPGDPVLAAERDHLERSREFLRLMREDVLSLRALGGDPVSEEYLKADLYRRAEALSDLPGTPLFFGSLARLRGRGVQRGNGSTWAAATCMTRPGGRWWSTGGHRYPGRSTGPARRTRWGCRCAAGSASPAGELTAHEDEVFAGPVPAQPGPRAQPGPGPAVSRILIDEIERPRSGPMRDIVATIAPDQDDIVRADAEQTLCVQGAPGTGKTAVGLHRVAYLLYAYAGRMNRGGVLVIGPNRAFLSYIRNVLPALGELNVTQTTLTDLVSRVPVRAADAALAARIKGDARMAEVLRRALWAGLAEPAEPVVLARGTRRWRLSGGDLADLVAGLRERGVRYAAGREMLGHRIAHVILTQMEAAGESCDDRTHESIRRSRPVRAAVDAIWPKADPVRLVLRLLSEPGLLAAAADGLLDEAEQQAIRWDPPPRGPASARWTAADAVLIDEASDLITRIPSLSHVVLDEAQDLSAMECRAAAGAVRRVRPRSSVTWPRAPHPAPSAAGPDCWSTWARATRSCGCCRPATGCRGRFSTSRTSCSVPWCRGWRRSARCALTLARWPSGP